MTMSSETHVETLLDIIVTSARQAIAEYKRGGNEVPTIHSKENHPLDFASDNVALGKAVRQLDGACQQLCASLLPPSFTITKLVAPSEWACMEVIVRTKVADALAKYPNGLPIDELSKLVSLEKGKLARILRFLTSKGCFIEVQPNIFSNNRTSLFTLSSSNSGALSRLLVDNFSAGVPVLYEAMTEPEYAASYDPEKTPFIYALQKRGFKGNYFDWLKEDDERRENFQRAMIAIAANSLSVLHYYPWNEIKTICDVGAGVGQITRPLWKMHPHLKITHQDLPEVINQAKSVWAKEAPDALRQNRVEFIPLNFLEQSPVQGQDVYYVRQVIHDWPDAEAAVILSNVRKAMAPHSRLLIHEAVLPSCTHDPNEVSLGLHDTPEPLLPSFGNMALMSDLRMLTAFNSKERMLDEYITLGSTAGLRFTQAYDLVETAILEFKITA